MTINTGGLIFAKCAQCNEHLVRITAPPADDIVICPVCWKGGSYKQVIEESAGLVEMPLSAEAKEFIEQQWIADKLRR